MNPTVQPEETSANAIIPNVQAEQPSTPPPTPATAAEAPPPNGLEHVRMTELIDAVARHRGIVSVAYALVVAALLGTVVYSSEFLGKILLYEEIDLQADWQFEKDGLGTRILVVACFVGLQALFIWGGGRVRLGNRPVKFYKRLIPLILYSALMTLSLIGLMLSAFELANTLEGTAEDVFEWRFFWQALVVVWCVWMVVGWVLVRNTDQPTALGRLLSAVLAGSWIEFSVALPIDLATRSRHEDCPCESGSWFALFFSVPVLLWAIGPGLYLLYLREKRLTESIPGHARRVLQRKTTRLKKAAGATP